MTFKHDQKRFKPPQNRTGWNSESGGWLPLLNIWDTQPTKRSIAPPMNLLTHSFVSLSISLCASPISLSKHRYRGAPFSLLPPSQPYLFLHLCFCSFSSLTCSSHNFIQVDHSYSDPQRYICIRTRWLWPPAAIIKNLRKNLRRSLLHFSSRELTVSGSRRQIYIWPKEQKGVIN